MNQHYTLTIRERGEVELSFHIREATSAQELERVIQLLDGLQSAIWPDYHQLPIEEESTNGDQDARPPG